LSDGAAAVVGLKKMILFIAPTGCWLSLDIKICFIKKLAHSSEQLSIICKIS